MVRLSFVDLNGDGLFTLSDIRLFIERVVELVVELVPIIFLLPGFLTLQLFVEDSPIPALRQVGIFLELEPGGFEGPSLVWFIWIVSGLFWLVALVVALVVKEAIKHPSE